MERLEFKEMRIVNEKIYESEGFCPEEEGFIPLDEPKEEYFFKMISILSFLAIIFTVFTWRFFTNTSFNIILFTISSIVIIIPHEFTHALFFPDKISSNNIIIGSYLKSGVFYAAYDGELTKKQLILTLLAPQITLTLIPLIIFFIIAEYQILLYVAVVNFICSFGDFASTIIVIKNFPKNAVGRNKGYKTYIKINK